MRVDGEETAALVKRMAKAVDWVQPERREAVAQLRVRALGLMVPAVFAAVEAAWRAELPADCWVEVRMAVRRGLQEGLANLTCSARSPRFPVAASYFSLFSRLPPYWEPPVAEAALESSLPGMQLRAYRWAAALLALEVRNQLEPLHHLHTSDDVMPALNRGVRQALYGVLLSDLDIACRVADLPRTLLSAMSCGISLEAPAVAG